MLTIHRDRHYTFRFTDDQLIPRFHLEGVEAGQRVSVFWIDADTGDRLALLTRATGSEGGWVDVTEPIIVRAGSAFIAVSDSAASSSASEIGRAHV